MPTVITQGAASAKGYGFGASAASPVYIEDVFSTWLYTGTGSAQTITNNIDLSTKGGMVWLKDRTQANPAFIMDTTRGTSSTLQPSTTGAAGAISTAITSFNTTGFTIGTNGNINTINNNYVSWTFRKQAKFFDVVIYTGNGTFGRAIPHNLGSRPGCIFVKRTSTAANWAVWHRSFSNTNDGYMLLNTTAAEANGGYSWWGSAGSSNNSTVFYVGDRAETNASGSTYVAYLFAHDAGGFGATGTDNVISCGSFTTDGSGNFSVNLGYEPQWVLIKSTDFLDSWYLIDVMRGMSQTGTNTLIANTAGAEPAYGQGYCTPTATGFTATTPGLFTGSQNFIYIAIRRGPMKTPTVGTSVFYPIAQTGNANNTSVGFSPDWTPLKVRNGVGNWFAYDRLRGLNASLSFNLTNYESTVTNVIDGWLMNGVDFGSSVGASDQIYVPCFRRAPGFFDVVCYTGTGVARTVNHNLGVTPELMIVKPRSLAGENWIVYCSLLNTPEQNRLVLNGTFGQLTTPNATWWNSTNPTSSVFSLGTPVGVNSSGYTYVNYLFSSVAGVSKVGSYTGTGTTNQINCGFTGGARFVMIKRTDSTGDWYVWDSARGIVAGNDSYLLLNSTAAEVTSTDYIDTYSAGFEISSTAPAAINANGGTFIFLAIA